MYSGITCGRVLDGELLYTKILEVNLFAFAYRLFHRDFSPINGAHCIGTHSFSNFICILYSFGSVSGWVVLSPVDWREISTKQCVGKCKQINF